MNAMMAMICYLILHTGDIGSASTYEELNNYELMAIILESLACELFELVF